MKKIAEQFEDTLGKYRQQLTSSLYPKYPPFYSGRLKFVDIKMSQIS